MSRSVSCGLVRFILRAALVVPGLLIAANDPGLEWFARVTQATHAIAGKHLDEAEKFYLLAAKVAEQFPAGDARVGTTWNSLGLVYREEKKYADSEKAFEKALPILQKAYGSQSLDAGNVNFNIATVVVLQGHYDAALPYIERSIAIYEKLLGATSLKVASVQCLQGDAYRGLKKFDLSESILKTCIKTRQDATGLQNAEVASALISLGLTYQAEGKLPPAEAQLKMAAKIREGTSGQTSPEWAEAERAHAAVLRAMGRAQDADKEELLANAAEKNKK